MISSSSRLADVINQTPCILSVIDRLNIRLGFHDATIRDICNRYGFSVELLTSIFNIYAHNGYEPQIDALSKQDILKLVKYLQTSHRYYSKKSFPKLHRKIHLLLKKGDASNAQILHKFYDDYSEELAHHFLFEETTVFPYVKRLLSNTVKVESRFDIYSFAQNHTNIEEKLSDLKNILLKYLPEDYPSALRIDLLNNIYAIEQDLARHTIIEDKMLIPAIIRLETISGRK